MEAAVGHVFIHGRLRWYRSHRCSVCPAMEEDGFDTPPTDIMNAVLAEEGAFELRVGAPPEKRVPALMVLRSALGLSIPEAGVLGRRLAHGETAATGTRAEMERLRHLLEVEGVEARVSRLV